MGRIYETELVVHDATPTMSAGSVPVCPDRADGGWMAVTWAEQTPVLPRLHQQLEWRTLPLRRVTSHADYHAPGDAAHVNQVLLLGEAVAAKRRFGLPTPEIFEAARQAGLCWLVTLRRTTTGGEAGFALNEDGTRGAVLFRATAPLPDDEEMEGYARRSAGAAPDID